MKERTFGLSVYLFGCMLFARQLKFKKRRAAFPYPNLKSASFSYII
jgi:hypothetical protein